MSRGLGRLPAPDERDARFLLSEVVPATTTRRWRYWYQGGWWGNQGDRPQCVGYAWAHLVEDSPILYPAAGPVARPGMIYRQAQKIDEWPGEDYEGTSVRAGAKVLQALGYIGTYRWAWDIDVALRCLLEEGPLIVGTWWYSGMDAAPRDQEPVSVSGARRGGHAYKVDGVNLNLGVVRCKNSWGRSWGHRGRFFLRIEDLERLILEDGEACMATESRVG